MNSPLRIKAALTLVALACAALAAAAQTPTPRPGATAPAAPAAGQAAAVPTAKIAVLNIALFREGIGELKQKYEKLNAEFAPRYQELQSMQTKMEAIQSQLEKAATLTAPQVRKLQEDGAALKKEYDRKTEDYQEMARKREEQETGATYAKVNEVLNKFAQQHGITLILEAGRAQEAGLIVYLDAKADITDAFMKEYNRANPVAAASAGPAQKNP
jgi:Skp family chaperone for outer membrane proteins